ncbi:MAG: hypothetical protein DRJ09_10095 [Bacteroidetes bacterium]|nr:MAG: hypothetical protein DRJ09_10095 [Bacteroidota bacterium]
MMKSKIKLGAVLLAAGRSKRMGMPKLALPFDEKRTFLEVITAGYLNFGCREIVVVVNEENQRLVDASKTTDSRIKIVVNEHPEWQRFYSVQLGLNSVNPGNSVFIHNIDNPFVDNALLQKMAESLSNDSYVVPVCRGHGGHPILLSSFIVHKIVNASGHSNHLKTFLSGYQRINVKTENAKILININTMEGFRKFKQLP